RAYGELYRGILRALEMALPGVSIYLGLLESGAQSIRYVACTRQSSMAGKQLKRGEGISFSCVGPRYAPYVLGRSVLKKPPLRIPKVFDYEGRVGWPFVCVPLEGFLRSSSIGVLGLDTFDQMVNSTSEHHQPEVGVVEMV
ncbi:unnamed protein product, partial [Hapterophycus canaliculatus]